MTEHYLTLAVKILIVGAILEVMKWIVWWTR